MIAKTLTCSACGWRTLSGRDDLISRLRLVGHLRREAEPTDALLEILIGESASRMTCPGCKSIGLIATDADSDASADEDDAWDDWQAATLCKVCRKPIPPERVEALPGVERCVECQGKEEAGLVEEEPDFCPRCGALVELRVRHTGGLTRYRRFCTAGCRID